MVNECCDASARCQRVEVSCASRMLQQDESLDAAQTCALSVACTCGIRGFLGLLDAYYPYTAIPVDAVWVCAPLSYSMSNLSYFVAL